LIDDEENSSIHCLMAKGEKVKINSKPEGPIRRTREGGVNGSR
jgi:hypothetical protein